MGIVLNTSIRRKGQITNIKWTPYKTNWSKDEPNIVGNSSFSCRNLIYRNRCYVHFLFLMSSNICSSKDLYSRILLYKSLVPHLMLIREESKPGIMNLDSGWLELHVQMSFKLAQIKYVKSSTTLEDVYCHNYYDWICFVCGSHNPILSSFMTYDRVLT
jgi:hypothetical protein